MSEFTFEILDSIEAPGEENKPVLCPNPKCKEDSLFRIQCFARCRKCGAVIVADHLQLPETYTMPWKEMSRIPGVFEEIDRKEKY